MLRWNRRDPGKATMKAEIFIVSGFLGAGKTTLIQKWLREGALQGKVAIVENDFGEVGIDAALLRSGAVHVTELSAGCICCSLSGDFVRALEDLITRYAPDTILIEPSGVGMLSDVKTACIHPRIEPLARMVRAVTVVDIRRMQRYLENFGAFYEDQIRRADAIVLSRVEQCPTLVAAVTERVIALNPKASVHIEPWDSLEAQDVLNADPAARERRIVIGRRSTASGGSMPNHAAEELFQTVTIHTDREFTPEELHASLQAAEQSCEMLLRAKGVLHTAQGYCLVQYTEGETQIEPSFVQGGFLCLIGLGLNSQALERIMTGE